MTECDASCLLLVNPGSPSPRGLGFITSGYPSGDESTLARLGGIWADRLQGAFPFAKGRENAEKSLLGWKNEVKKMIERVAAV